MRATIRQVAALAGVSRTTVSNVLLGREGRIAPEKREAVLRIVEELGYVPVRPALQNRRAETRVLAIAVGRPELIRFDFHSKVYAGICDAALRHDYDVLTVLRSDPDWAVNHSAVRLLDGRSDGILLFPSDEGDDATLKSLAHHGTPVVVLYRRAVPKGISWVDPDNEGAINALIEHLMVRGHRRIAHLTCYLKTQFDFRERLRAFGEAVDRHALPKLEGGIIVAENHVTPELADQVLESGATAVLCANDWLAFRLWDHLEQRGCRIPEDLSLVGIDNQQLGERGGLTTMGFTYEEVGCLAVEALLARIQGRSAEECHCVVPLQLLEGTSVKTI